MMKGVAPILATVLIVLIVIFLGGGLFVYLNQTQEELTGETGEQTREFTDTLAAKISIASLSCDTATDRLSIRNDGTGDASTFSNANVTVIVAGAPQTGITWTATGGGACSTTNVEEGCLLHGTFSSDVVSVGDKVEVFVGEASTTRTCSN